MPYLTLFFDAMSGVKTLTNFIPLITCPRAEIQSRVISYDMKVHQIFHARHGIKLINSDRWNWCHVWCMAYFLTTYPSLKTWHTSAVSCCTAIFLPSHTDVKIHRFFWNNNASFFFVWALLIMQIPIFKCFNFWFIVVIIINSNSDWKDNVIMIVKSVFMAQRMVRISGSVWNLLLWPVLLDKPLQMSVCNSAR